MGYEGEDELGIGDLNEFTYLKTLKLNEDSISSIPTSTAADIIPKTVLDIQIHFQISNSTIEYNNKIPDYTTSIFNLYVLNQIDIGLTNLLSKLKSLTSLEIGVISNFNIKLTAGFFSDSITNLNLGCDWNNGDTPLSLGDLPNSLTNLKIIGYKQELDTGILPSSLTSLEINHPGPGHNKWVLPTSLKQLSINQSLRNSDISKGTQRQFTIDENLLSSNTNLTKLKISPDNVTINANSIPNSIEYLNISGTLVNSSISKSMLPNSLKTLKFKPSSNKFKFEDDALPVTLTHLQCKCSWNYTFKNQISNCIWNEPIGNISFFPQSLTFLDFGEHWNQPLELNVLPNNLLDLRFGTNFNQPLNPNVLPLSLTSLFFPNNSNFNQSLLQNSIPSNLKTLYLGSSYSQLIKPGIIPHSLKTLCISITNQNVLQVGSIPNSVEFLLISRPSSIKSTFDCFDQSTSSTSTVTPISSYVLTTPNIIPTSVIKMSLPTSIFKNCEIPLFVEKILYR